MAKTKKEKRLLNFDDKEYDIESMTDEQKTILNHVNDLQNKMNNMKFNMNQLEVGKEAFVNMLRAALVEAIEPELI